MNITTPCHGTPLIVLTTHEGGYLGSDVPSEIICGADKCYNSWDAAGTVVVYYD